MELASRIEEARTSGKLLLQVVQSTAPAEVTSNDLIKEFAGRCASASRSIQGYIAADNPPPDEDTMLTLIETNDQLAMAMSKHQRAVLNARRLTSSASATPSPSQASLSAPPPLPPHPSQPSPPAISTSASLYPPPQQPSRASSNAFAAPIPASNGGTYLPPQSNPFDDSNADGNSAEAPAPSAALTPPTNGTTSLSPPNNDPSSAAYHPAYRPTPSYVHRQESSAEHVTMHGASAPGQLTGAPSEEEEEPEVEQPRRYRF